MAAFNYSNIENDVLRDRLKEAKGIMAEITAYLSKTESAEADIIKEHISNWLK